MLFVSLNLQILDGHPADSFSTIKLLKLLSTVKIHRKDHSSFLGHSLLVLNDLVLSGTPAHELWQKADIVGLVIIWVHGVSKSSLG